MNPGKLQKIDNQKGEEYAQILNKTAKMNYKQFLREYNLITDPFLHDLQSTYLEGIDIIKRQIRLQTLMKKRNSILFPLRKILFKKNYKRNI